MIFLATGSLEAAFSLALNLTFEAQDVILLRFLKLTTGGLSAFPEAIALVPEKIVGAIAIQAVLALSVVSGRTDLAAVEIMAMLLQRVRDNDRRLRGGF